jgi:hypothetical protein
VRFAGERITSCQPLIRAATRNPAEGEARLSNAQQRAGFRSRSLTEIALEVGSASLHGFPRALGRKLGVTSAGFEALL